VGGLVDLGGYEATALDCWVPASMPPGLQVTGGALPPPDRSVTGTSTALTSDEGRRFIATYRSASGWSDVPALWTANLDRREEQSQFLQVAVTEAGLLGFGGLLAIRVLALTN
jgi:hypothetical protein